MITQPTLHTERLTLRRFVLEDAPTVQRLAADEEVARTLLAVPHPYPDGLAEVWISSHEEHISKGEAAHFAIERNEDRSLIGAVGFRLELDHERAELGYWIGKPYWGRGYCTEAAHAVVRYAFETLGLQRIYAFHFTMNPASGRVLQKVGMKHEGRRRRHTLKGGTFLDSEAYGILREDFTAFEAELTK